MMRLLLFAFLAASLGAALSACSDENYYGYGYAANERPSLAQLGVVNGDPANSFGAAPPVETADSH